MNSGSTHQWAPDDPELYHERTVQALAETHRSHAPEQVRVSASSLEWPAKCACCEGVKEIVYPVSATRVGVVKSFDVPYCRACLNHVKFFEQANAISEQLGVVSEQTQALETQTQYTGVQDAGDQALKELNGLEELRDTARQLYQEFAIIMIDANATLTDNCCCVGPAVIYERHYGTLHEFVFKNTIYAQSFKEANKRSLVI